MTNRKNFLKETFASLITGKCFNVAFFIILLSCGSLYSQYDADALRFSRIMPTGSARFAGMGGAMGALGADISNSSNNPAGVGVFRGSTISLTPSLFFSTDKSSYQKQNFSDDRFNFNFGNIGMVFSMRMNKEKTKGLQFLNLTIGYNRTANFNRNSFSSGSTDQYSLGHVFANNAQGISPNNLDRFYERLAFNTYVIDTIPGTGGNQYGVNGPIIGNKTGIRKQVGSNGSIGDVTLGGAANFSNKFYVGITANISILNYKNITTYTEDNSFGTVPGFNNFSFQELQDISGVGFNLKLGAIYRATDWLRIGASFHTPTWYSMGEVYTNTMYSSFSFGNYKSESPIGNFDYFMRTPLRVQVSLGFIALKYALIGLEYEFADYSQIRLNSNGGLLQQYNQNMMANYRGTHNAKIGAEFRFDPIRIRLGYNFLMSPYKLNNANIDNNNHIVSAGIGFRSKKLFSFDLTYQLAITNREDEFQRLIPNLGNITSRVLYNNILASVSISF